MEKWDAIIIGAGPSGLCTGALLAKAGKKMLLLEKQPFLGGRRRCGSINGIFLEDGPFGPSRAGFLAAIARDELERTFQARLDSAARTGGRAIEAIKRLIAEEDEEEGGGPTFPGERD